MHDNWTSYSVCCISLGFFAHPPKRFLLSGCKKRKNFSNRNAFKFGIRSHLLISDKGIEYHLVLPLHLSFAAPDTRARKTSTALAGARSLTGELQVRVTVWQVVTLNCPAQSSHHDCLAVLLSLRTQSPRAPSPAADRRRRRVTSESLRLRPPADSVHPHNDRFVVDCVRHKNFGVG